MKNTKCHNVETAPISKRKIEERWIGFMVFPFHLTSIFLLDIGAVSTVWHFVFFIAIPRTHIYMTTHRY